MTSAPGGPSNGTAPATVLRPVSGQDAGFDPDGLARVDEVVRGALDIVFPAAALLVARGGGVVLHRAYGFLDPDRRGRPVATGSLFDLASVTKLFTATAFMTLVEGGQVSLDTPVAQVLPEFDGVRPIGPAEDPITKRPLPPDPAFAGREIDARQVTFWHLLTHTSGLAAWGGLYREESGGDAPVPLPHQVSPERRGRRIAAITRRYGFAYPPGERLVYSDLGLILLGEAAARLSGMPLDALVQCAVLDPLGLAHTAYNPLARGITPDCLVPTEFCAWRERRCLGEVHDENAAGLGGIAGHAGLFSTAWEVAVLGQTYLNGGCYDGVRVLSPGTVAEMTRVHVDPGDNPRALAWLQRSRQGSSSGRWFGPRSYGHTGYTGTSLWVDPDRALVVALLTNRVYGGRDPAGIAAFRPRLHDAVVEAMR
ncbi:MAG: serine hydrolase [Anaerolineae bacterium]|nr:serine hydrolase [Anaerolineae bacterium]